VLLHFCHDRMCRQLAAVAGVAEDIVRRVVLDETTLRRHETGQLNPNTFLEYFNRQTGTSADVDRWTEAVADIFTVNESILPIVDRLATAGHRLGVLSNTNEIHWRFVTDGRFAPLLPGPFEHAVLSYEVGAMKPDPAIYAAAAERARVQPHEILFTDDREENVAAAREAGFSAVLFQGTADLCNQLARHGIAR